MTMVNTLYRLESAPARAAILREGISIVLRLLAPIAPHVTHHLWRELGFGADILHADWPQVDEQALKQDRLDYVVQVNGKVRGSVKVAADADQATVQAAALANEQIAKFIDGKPLRKVILVPGKLLNLVV